MAETKKKRVIKKAETVRERVERGEQPGKRRVVKGTGSLVAKPFKAVGRAVAFVLRPFSFLLIPFKTKPARFVGRILSSILLFKFFRESWQELRQVQWPTAKETYRLTVAVFIFAVIFGAIVAALDEGLGIIFKKLFVD